MSGEATVRREVEKRLTRAFLTLTDHARDCIECQEALATDPRDGPDCDAGAPLYQAWRVLARALRLSTGALD